MKPIAHIESPYKAKFGVPRQAGLAEGEAKIVFEPEFRVAEAVRGLDEFEYIWIVWQFHLVEEKFRPTVRPPRLGGNKRVGVFATRSPFRPNRIALSSVRLLRVCQDGNLGTVIYVEGADMVDGTPIFDIKPYIPYADSHPHARASYAAEAPHSLVVADEQGLLLQLPPSLQPTARQALASDPRPHYQNDPCRTYTFDVGDYEVVFSVDGEVAKVLNVCRRDA